MKKQSKNAAIAIFEGAQIRRHWNEEKELWYFAISDVIAVLTKSIDPVAYWRKLKERLLKEGGNETVTKCHALMMMAPDGKMRLIDVADTEVMLRLVQSIPSPNAEPFNLWLARVGYERLEETADPELAINRALKTYLQKGYSPDWVNQRLKSIEIRKALTDEWENRSVKEGLEFAILTDEITQAWTGMTTYFQTSYMVDFICQKAREPAFLKHASIQWITMPDIPSAYAYEYMHDYTKQMKLTMMP